VPGLQEELVYVIAVYSILILVHAIARLDIDVVLLDEVTGPG
jgi:hypothetical protein